MTTLHMQNPHHPAEFGLSAAEDPMELTSDIDRRFEAEEDLDIDLDLAGENQQDQEDEYMNEDVNDIPDNVRVDEQDLHMGNDDNMTDDTYLEVAARENSSLHDEDLEDADYVGDETGVELDVDPDPDPEGYPVITTGAEHPSSPKSELIDNDIDVEDTPQEGHLSHETGVELGLRLEHNDEDAQEHEQVQQQEQGTSPSDQQDQSFVKHQNMHENGSATVENLPSVRASNFTRTSPPLPDRVLQGLSQEDLGRLNQAQEPLLNPQDDEIHLVEQLSTQNEGYEVNGVPDTSELPFEGPESNNTIHEGNLATNLEANQSDNRLDVSVSEQKITDTSSTNIIFEVQNGSNDKAEDPSKALSYLHPVLVAYQDNEISLFPPINQEEEHDSTYFLQDEQLANDPIRNILEACRSVLGESISEQDELTIEIEELGLHISESTPESATTSLKHLIDIYVHLQNNDAVEDPPALYVTLTANLRFSHRFSYLMSVVADGKGLSQVKLLEEAEDSRPPAVSRGNDPVTEQDTKETKVLIEPELNLGGYSGDGALEKTLNKDIADELSSGPSPSGIEDASPQILEQQSGTEVNTSKSDDAEDQSNSIELIDSENQADHQHGGPKHNNGTNTKLSSRSPVEIDHQDPSTSTIEDGDFIDYEDDEEPAVETSTDSSTLQGDPLELVKENDLGNAEIFPPVISQEAPLHSGDKVQQGNTESHIAAARSDDVKSVVQTEERPVGQSNDFEDALHPLENDATSYHEFDGKAVACEEPIDTEELKAIIEVRDQGDQEDANDLDNQDAISESSYGEAYLSSTNTGQPLEAGLVVGDEPLEAVPDDEEEGLDQALDHQQDGDSVSPESQIHQGDVENILNDAYHEDGNDNVTPSGNPINIHYTMQHSQEEELEHERAEDDEEDEITFDDEEPEDEAPHQAISVEIAPNLSPGSLKRPRSLHEGQNEVEDDVQDPKRFRSR